MNDLLIDTLTAAIEKQTKAINDLSERIKFLDETVQMNDAHHKDTQQKLMLLVTVLEKTAR